MWKITTNKTKATKRPICSSKEALTSAKPILICDGLLVEFTASEAPLPARISTTESSAIKVVQTRPGWRGDR